MPNVSKEVKVRIVLWVDPMIAERIEEARLSTNLRSKQQWIYMAISSYLSKWKKPASNDQLWDKCYHCGKRHDPIEAHGA